MRKSNLVLTGMPGAGKSTAGVLAAKALGMNFIDTDLLLQQKAKRLLQEIIGQEGIAAFLAREEETILGLAADNCVIATGGSVIYSHKSMEHLRQKGLVIYLMLPLAELEVRIKNMSSRGIVMAAGQDLHSLYLERTPLYRASADLVLDCSGQEIEETVTAICTAARGHLR
ncbi:MAG TPA: shikimate kinase [Firmicutes bacterium]|nr:shikimate kinase [Bacillota bacterium]